MSNALQISFKVGSPLGNSAFEKIMKIMIHLCHVSFSSVIISGSSNNYTSIVVFTPMGGPVLIQRHQVTSAKMK